MKKILIFILCVLFLQGCSSNETIDNTNINYSKVHTINMTNNKATMDDKEINEYDYSWHISPEKEDEWYEGNAPRDEDVYIAHDIIYYPLIDESSFSKETYDGEIEWVTKYTAQDLKNYIFGCLPVLGDEIPKQMMHSEEEAYNNPVIHINKAGTYILQGEWRGQIKIDLGEDSFLDETQKVTVILNGCSVTCDVAPAIIFSNVYEVDNTWEEVDEHSNLIDLENAGAKVIIMDGTENNFTGANVYRLLKPIYKKEGSNTQKKRYKTDGAFYSFQSLLIKSEEKGTGILNITSTTYEGLNSELHLTIDSGYINIVSQDDGINVNEDGVSVLTINGGRTTIFAGQGFEGDVIDSNGYIKVNKGTLLGTTPSMSDEILDSDFGCEVSEEAIVIDSGKNKFKQDFIRPTPNKDGSEFKPAPPIFDSNRIPENIEKPLEIPIQN